MSKCSLFVRFGFTIFVLSVTFSGKTEELEAQQV